ncbi:MAG: 23S rRNA (cytidine(2498)-2'-O)-methyltransferase RlmM, partial [Gammaproteobacteria bacterium]
QPGMRAVDLGAAPGGWTWQLVRRHLRVIAVDNGAMDPALMDSGLVEHRQADGFGFQPDATVDWMVCDMVEKPMAVASLAARWIGNGWCRHAVFNLKLPMKQRYRQLQRCLTAVEDDLRSAGVRYRLACKQLYHDREEVTVYLTRSG